MKRQEQEARSVLGTIHGRVLGPPGLLSCCGTGSSGGCEHGAASAATTSNVIVPQKGADSAAQWPPPMPIILLLGDPGSGRSSFINYMCGRYIQAVGGPGASSAATASATSGAGHACGTTTLPALSPGPLTVITSDAVDSDAFGDACFRDGGMARLGLEGIGEYGPSAVQWLHVKRKTGMDRRVLRTVIVEAPGFAPASAAAAVAFSTFPADTSIDKRGRNTGTGTLPPAMPHVHQRASVLQFLCERADLILYFVDVHTAASGFAGSDSAGAAAAALRHLLCGADQSCSGSASGYNASKTLVVLNKIDDCGSPFHYAEAMCTLGWNLGLAMSRSMLLSAQQVATGAAGRNSSAGSLSLMGAVSKPRIYRTYIPLKPINGATSSHGGGTCLGMFDAMDTTNTVQTPPVVIETGITKLQEELGARRLRRGVKNRSHCLLPPPRILSGNLAQETALFASGDPRTAAVLQTPNPSLSSSVNHDSEASSPGFTPVPPAASSSTQRPPAIPSSAAAASISTAGRQPRSNASPGAAAATSAASGAGAGVGRPVRLEDGGYMLVSQVNGSEAFTTHRRTTSDDDDTGGSDVDEEVDRWKRILGQAKSLGATGSRCGAALPPFQCHGHSNADDPSSTAAQQRQQHDSLMRLPPEMRSELLADLQTVVAHVHNASEWHRSSVERVIRSDALALYVHARMLVAVRAYVLRTCGLGRRVITPTLLRNAAFSVVAGAIVVPCIGLMADAADLLAIVSDRARRLWSRFAWLAQSSEGSSSSSSNRYENIVNAYTAARDSAAPAASDLIRMDGGFIRTAGYRYSRDGTWLPSSSSSSSSSSSCGAAQYRPASMPPSGTNTRLTSDPSPAFDVTSTVIRGCIVGGCCFGIGCALWFGIPWVAEAVGWKRTPEQKLGHAIELLTGDGASVRTAARNRRGWRTWLSLPAWNPPRATVTHASDALDPWHAAAAADDGDDGMDALETLFISTFHRSIARDTPDATRVQSAWRAVVKPNLSALLRDPLLRSAEAWTSQSGSSTSTSGSHATGRVLPQPTEHELRTLSALAALSF